MVYKLSISNIKKSFKDYAIYFVTLILGVCIFYVFNSISSQTVMSQVTARQTDTIKNIESSLGYVSVFVSVVLGFLIIYASRFFIKKRNKEFAIYMTLGMSKRKISYILLTETFFIGVVSLGIGLVVGIGLSQVTSVFVVGMFEADMKKFSFVFSKEAMAKTILYFGIIYLVVMVFNTVVINKQKLIDLMQGSKKQEKIKFKNSFICGVSFVIACLMLSVAYYYLFMKPEEIYYSKNDKFLIPMIMALLFVGTLLFFYSLAGIMLKVLKKCYRTYYNKLNTFAFKQVSSKINTMVTTMSIICIMIAITLCLLSYSITLKNYYNYSIEKYVPVDFQLAEELKFQFGNENDNSSVRLNEDDNEGFISNNNQEVSLNDFINKDAFMKNNIKDITTINYYENEDFYYENLLEEYENELDEPITLEFRMKIMGESDYNKMAKLYKLDTLKLKDDEYAIVANTQMDVYKKVLNKNTSINLFNKNLKPYKKVIDGFMEVYKEPVEKGFCVVKDSIIKIDNKTTKKSMLMGNYSTKDKKNIEKLDKKIEGLDIYKHTKSAIKEATIGKNLLLTFISIYLGIIFLISSAAILALKGLSDCLDDKEKYKTLRKIGSDEKDINKALFKQSFIFYILPLALASLHFVFALKFCVYILSRVRINDIMSGALVTFAFLIAIYGIYFIVTYVCSKGIIKGKTS